MIDLFVMFQFTFDIMSKNIEKKFLSITGDADWWFRFSLVFDR